MADAPIRPRANIVMEDTPTLDSRYVTRTLDGVRAAGIDLPAILQKADIAQQDLETPGTRIPVIKMARLMNLCRVAMDDEEFGRLEKPVPMGTFRLTLLAPLHLPRLGPALERLIEHFNISKNSLQFFLHVGDTLSEFEVRAIPNQKQVDCSLIDMYLMAIHRLMMWYCGQNLPLDRVTRRTAPPDYSDEYPAFYFGAPVLFEQDRDSIVFNSHYLKNPIIQDEESTESYLRRAPLGHFLPLQQITGGLLTAKVTKLAYDFLKQAGKLPTLEQMADQLGYKVRNLRKRLQDDGSSYHDIKLQVRRDIAIHHLSLGKLTVEDVANKAGYTEASVFVRAFKGWTGMSPLQFKKGVEAQT